MPRATLDMSSDTTPALEGTLLRHAKRPEWGVAVLAWERDGHRGYQFEDGRLRKIRKGYYKLLEPVDELEAPEAVVRKNLERAMVATGGEATRSIKKKVAPFEDQLELFVKLYPKGFMDPAWIADHRGDPNGSALKRHRDPSLADAQEALAADRCNGMVVDGQHDTLFESIVDVLAGSNLLPISHVKDLRQLDDDERRRYSESVADVLHGERHFDERFRDYLDVLTSLLGGRPSWRIATALPSLVHPQTHVSVRRSAFARQAGSIAPTARYTRTADVGAYKNYLRVAQGVKTRLVDAGHEPRDLLDIHDFIWDTLRTSALGHLGEDDEDDE
ncbi:MAG: hypothetical protein OEN56_01700 [Gemmatimonadota bacterium]|nr:hypothetical protein [Gemmatimonadota bacterium]